MKNLFLAAALIAATASGALAETTGKKLPQTMEFEILLLVPDADLSNLTNQQWARLHALFVNSANLRVGESPAQRIKVILASEE